MNGEPIAFAGLWETWTGPNGEELETATIITTNASRDLAVLHERMPVIVPPDAFDLWLDCSNVDAMTASVLFAPVREGSFDTYEVSPAVNRADNDGPQLIEPAQQAEEPEPISPKRKAQAKKDDGQASLF
jgi:putative SOS response-associated peptidase YedK